MLRRFFSVWLLPLCALLLSACSKDKTIDPSTDDTTASHTVLVYIVAENSLLSYAADDVKEMLSACGRMTYNDRLVIYYDGDSNPCIYEVDKYTQARTLADLKPYYTYATDHNSASADVLKAFVAMAEKRFPADDYSLILWSHGSGWIPQTTVTSPFVSMNQGPKRTFGLDNGVNDTSDVGDEMEISDMAEALSSFNPFRFIFFDACFMQSAEVVYELRHVAQYIVASPAEIPGTGAPYDKLMACMFLDTLDPQVMVNAYVTAYAGQTNGVLLSCVDCELIDSLTSSMRTYLHPLCGKEATDVYGLTSVDFSTVQNYFDYDLWSARHLMPDCYDIYSVMKHALSQRDFETWSQLYDRAVYRRANTCWFSQYPWSNKLSDHLLPVDDGQYGGMSMFLPLDKYVANGHYFFLDWLQTEWGQRMAAD